MSIAFRSATEAGTPSAANNVTINVPSGVADGDLLLLFACHSDSDDPGDFDDPSGWTRIVDNVLTNTAPSTPGGTVWWRIADSEPANYNLTDTPVANQGLCAQMLAFTGTDETTPIDATPTTTPGSSTNANPPSLTSVTDGCQYVVACWHDSTAISTHTVPTGFTDPDSQGRILGNGGGNGCSLGVAYRTALQVSFGALDPPAFTTGNEQWAACTIALRPAPEGITSVTPSEFDMDNADIDVASTADVFDASGNDVYLSDVDTLAGGPNEVDISSAINTEAIGLINLDLTLLSDAELDSLHTLGPSATRFVIVDTASDEFSFPITLHRPQAIEMSLGGIVPGVTTSRLTGMTGTFGGGRAEETAAQNPSTTNTNVADDGRREDVWSIEAKPLAREEIYDFRLIYSGSGLVAETITTTPQITLAVPAGVPPLVMAPYQPT